jgi:shikimate kinase
MNMININPLPLVLTGMMGSGKSTVGSLLAIELGREFFDLDGLIEQKCGRQIPQLFEESGESAFRELEEVVLAEALQQGNPVIAAGGGVLLSSKNRQLLHDGSRVLLLEAPLPELEQRLASVDRSRPLLNSSGSLAEQLERLHSERQHLYCQTADIVVDTVGLNPQQVVTVILNMLENYDVSI